MDISQRAMPTFCRHNRFIERCPICSKTLPGNAPASSGSTRAKPSTPQRSSGERASRRRTGKHAEHVRVRHEARAVDDGYRCGLVAGLRASADAYRLAEAIAFSSGRLLALGARPPGMYGEARALAAEDLERATWICFLLAYLCPVDGDDPFAGIRLALAELPDPFALPVHAPPGEVASLREIPLGPRTSHDPQRGADTLLAYRDWVERAPATSAAASPTHRAGMQAIAFTGDPAWSPERRFERVFERLALPGFTRVGRYELLVLLARLGLYELRPDALHLAGGRGIAGEDATTLAAKRVFGIGDPLLLERRATALAQAASVPVETLDLALANWASPQPAALGFAPETGDADAFQRAGDALEL
ncbi:MAG TPA: hypothetical protein VMF09_02175 [Solirubrobacteraceae bacterium]|nr:hypothetical protein [Solirubrobacteraceae bacterium]